MTSLIASRTKTSLKCSGTTCHGAGPLHLETRIRPDGSTVRELYCPTCQPRGAQP